MQFNSSRALIMIVALTLMIGIFATACKDDDDETTTPVLQDHPMTFSIAPDTATVTCERVYQGRQQTLVYDVRTSAMVYQVSGTTVATLHVVTAPDLLQGNMRVGADTLDVFYEAAPGMYWPTTLQYNGVTGRANLGDWAAYENLLANGDTVSALDSVSAVIDMPVSGNTRATLAEMKDVILDAVTHLPVNLQLNPGQRALDDLSWGCTWDCTKCTLYIAAVLTGAAACGALCASPPFVQCIACVAALGYAVTEFHDACDPCNECF